MGLLVLVLCFGECMIKKLNIDRNYIPYNSIL
jgi:hypothetical protein